MANYKTGAQRYNDRMDKIFKRSEELGNHTLHGSTEKSSAMSKALEAKKGTADHINAERKRQGYKPRGIQKIRHRDSLE